MVDICAGWEICSTVVAFDSLSHTKLLAKLNAYGIRGNVLSWLEDVSFLIYVDYLAKLLECHGIVVKLFADDVKVYLEIVNSNDVDKPQCALDLITNWAEDWQLSISISKCNAVTIGKPTVCRKYYISGVELPHSAQCKDLGIDITSDLSPSDHIQQITAKAHQRANNILRCFVSGNISSLVRAFLVHVRSVLKYNSVLWSPHRT